MQYSVYSTVHYNHYHFCLVNLKGAAKNIN